MRNTRPWTILLLPLTLFSAARAAPAEIIFLRHGEKPEHGPELNARGWERAQALATLFTHDRRVLDHGRAVAIYAASPATAGGSIRSIQTMEATGKALKISVDREISRDDIDGLVRAIMGSPAYKGKTVLVCWEHKKIPEMLPAFGWPQGPKRWDDSIFDRLWILEFDHGRPARFLDLPEKLLSGDSVQ
jgi:hypothetical protein